MLITGANTESTAKEIMDKQFICNCYTDEEKEEFRKACMV